MSFATSIAPLAPAVISASALTAPAPPSLLTEREVVFGVFANLRGFAVQTLWHAQRGHQCRPPELPPARAPLGPALHNPSFQPSVRRRPTEPARGEKSDLYIFCSTPGGRSDPAPLCLVVTVTPGGPYNRPSAPLRPPAGHPQPSGSQLDPSTGVGLVCSALRRGGPRGELPR